MTGNGRRLTAEDMRRAFDRTFAAPVVEAARETVSLLAIRAGELFLAMRTAEIAGLIRCPKITPAPARSPALLGVSAVRDALIGMYGLSSLIGGAAGPEPRGWVALCKDRSVGLVFSEIEGYVQVDSSAIHLPDRATALDLAAGVVTLYGSVRAVIDITALLARIKARGQAKV